MDVCPFQALDVGVEMDGDGGTSHDVLQINAAYLDQLEH